MVVAPVYIEGFLVLLIDSLVLDYLSQSVSGLLVLRLAHRSITCDHFELDMVRLGLV